MKADKLRRRRVTIMLAVALAILVAAVAVSFRVAFSQPKPAVSIGVVSDPPLVIRSKSPVADEDGRAWFEHDLTVKNTSDRAIKISRDRSPSEANLGNGQLLIGDDGCGPASPLPGEMPGIGCFAMAYAPIEVEPHASAKLTTISVYSELAGMPKRVPGDYVWKKDVTWWFADAAEHQKAHVEITYRVK
jgi:hypothetical protein